MEKKIASVSIIVENTDSVEALNRCLHAFGPWIIGRMGLPYQVEDRKIHIISIAMDASQEVITALTQEISALPGVSVQTACSSISHC